MKKVTKKQLVEKGQLIGIELPMKLTLAQMIEKIEAKEKELAVIVPEPKKMAKDDIVVLNEKVSDCGCSYVYPKTIAKLLETNGKGFRKNNIRFCNSGCTVWVSDNAIRSLTEAEAKYAENRFSNATSYIYATVD